MRNNNETVYCLEDYMVDVSFGKLFFKANEIILLLQDYKYLTHHHTHIGIIVVVAVLSSVLGIGILHRE